MKKHWMKKVFSVLAVSAMTLALLTPAMAAEEAETKAASEAEAEAPAGEEESGSGEEVSLIEMTLSEDESYYAAEMMAGPNSMLFYHPTPNANEELPVNTTCTAPVFIVFGEKDFSEEAFDNFAKESGLYDIAAEEGSSICFVRPQGEAWTEADAAAYEAIAGMIGDSSTNEHVNGFTTGFNFFAGGMTQSITGTAQRVYVYGIGEGADFVAANLLKKYEQTVTFGDGFSMVNNLSAAGVTLLRCQDASMVEETDIPVVSLHASKEVNEALEKVCKNLYVSRRADYLEAYEKLTGLFRRQAGVIVPVHDWAAEGIVEKVETFMAKTSPDNVTFPDAEEHEIGYIVYYAEDLDVKEGKVPLVFCFHGGGNTALYEAQATEWPIIGKEYGFITVSVDLHHPNVPAAEVAQLLEHLKEEYSIDESRVYGSGFSMGGCKSWDIFEQIPELFAGVAPMDATTVPGEDSYNNKVENPNADVLLPVFWVGGEVSPLPEMPFQDQKCVDRAANVFAVNKVVADYSGVKFEEKDSWANKIWGIDGDITYVVPDEKYFLDSDLTVHLFASEDGNYYTAFASASNQSHEVYARNSWAAWDFLSQFSRGEDGKIVIAEGNGAAVAEAKAE